MVKNEYKKAFKEVWEILKNISQEDYKKIPKDIIEIIKEEKDDDYNFEYEVTKTLDEQNVSEKAKTIIAIFYRDYWSEKEQREQILKYEKAYRMKKEIIKSEEYNAEGIFKKQKNSKMIKNNGINNGSLIEVKNKWYQN